MAQSNGVTTLKRMEFEFKGLPYSFLLNPEEYSQSEPSRINVTQTKGGAWTDDFGAGLVTISMKGTTGFKGVFNNPNTGFSRLVLVRTMIRDYYDDGKPGQVLDNRSELIFHNYTDEEHWVVIPKVFNLMRSVARPLLYLYDIQLICLRRADTPDSSTVAASGAVTPTLSRVEVVG